MNIRELTNYIDSKLDAILINEGYKKKSPYYIRSLGDLRYTVAYVIYDYGYKTVVFMVSIGSINATNIWRLFYKEDIVKEQTSISMIMTYTGDHLHELGYLPFNEVDVYELSDLNAYLDSFIFFLAQL